MAPIIALLAALAWPLAAAATDVALVGVIGGTAAVLVLDGGEPKTVKAGQRWRGVTVVSVGRDRATVLIDGKPRVLLQGQHYRSAQPATDRPQVTLAADPRGHFLADGAVNGVRVRFLVDTGATLITLPGADALRLGLDYRKGRRGVTRTASGLVPVYHLQLDRVSLGAVELLAVEAMVIEQGLDVALLGMSFLNRVEMQRDGDSMTLIRRF
ncbi:MAG TPA: TIGR02281 family clan AA aspartic protease [Burkholderiales bacterium]|nr:TIGR02281 family clan AA aspartic protease [Burkholderiales bacterium]